VIEQLAYAPPCCLDSALVGFAQQGIELGEGLLDEVEVRTMRREEEAFCAGRADRTAFAAAEIVPTTTSPSRRVGTSTCST
jgi:hypothetical protein